MWCCCLVLSVLHKCSVWEHKTYTCLQDLEVSHVNCTYPLVKELTYYENFPQIKVLWIAHINKDSSEKQRVHLRQHFTMQYFSFPILNEIHFALTVKLNKDSSTWNTWIFLGTLLNSDKAHWAIAILPTVTKKEHVASLLDPSTKR